MRYRWLSFALALVLTSCLQGTRQTDDGLLADSLAIRARRDSVLKGIDLSWQGEDFLNLSKIDTSLSIYQGALAINLATKNDSMIASNWNDIGGIYHRKGEFDSAVYCYEKAIVLFNRMGNAKRTASLKVNIAKIFRERGAYESALELLFSAALVLEKEKPDKVLASCYNSIALTYRSNQDYQKAIIYNRKALGIRRDLNDIANVAGSLNNIGNVFVDLHNYDSALYYFNRSLEIKRTLGDKSIASTLHNLGDVKFEQGDVENAKAYYEEALMLKKQSKDKTGEIQSLIGLARCYVFKKQYGIALRYLNESAVLEIEVGNLLQERRQILELYVVINRATDQYAKALGFANQLLAVKDSLYNDEKKKAMTKALIEYEIDTREQRIKLLNSEQELNRANLRAKNLWIFALVVAIFLTLVIILLVYNNSRLAKKGKQRVEILLKELHHRVKNNLQILSSMISLQAQNLTDGNAILSAKSTEGRINAMALIHRKLYSDEHNTIVSTRGYFRELIEYLVSSYGFGPDRLALTVDIDEVDVDVDKAIRMGLVVNELISNAFKHAYSDAREAALTVRVKQQQNQLLITVADNGPGLPDDYASAEEKFGTRLVALLVKELKGTYTVQRGAGTSHILSFPLT